MSHAAPTHHGSFGSRRAARTAATIIGAAIVASAATLAVVNAIDTDEGAPASVTRSTGVTSSDAVDDRELSELMRGLSGDPSSAERSRPPGGGPLP